MSAIFAGNLSGYFTQPATAAPVFLPFPTGVDFINVYNITNAITKADNAIVSASYYNNPSVFPTPTGLYTGIQTAYDTTGAYLLSAPLAPGQGFFYQNTSISLPGAPVATTA